MVTRKSSPGASEPPYPVTPIKTSSFHIQDAHAQLLPSATDTETPSSAWATEGATDGLTAPVSSLESVKAQQAAESSIPLSLQPAGGRAVESSSSTMERSSNEHIPESLRPGPERSTLKSTNPFRQQNGQATSQGVESSAGAWDDTSERPSVLLHPARPAPTSEEHASKLFENLSLDQSGSTNPWELVTPKPHALETSSSETSATKAWNTSAPGSHPPASADAELQDERASVSSLDSDDWNDERTGSASKIPSTQEQTVSPINEEHDAWEDNYKAPPRSDTNVRAERAQAIEDIANETNGWENRGESSGVNAGQGSRQQEDILPPLPPRQSIAPAPSRPAVNTSSDSTESRDQMLKETYEIKKISWHDVTAPFNPRVSPILVQNRNGPCPLMALVNALTITTPADMDTGLVERLRSREQVSVQFLLEGVIDELMSGRRTDGAQELPDPSDLFSFLVNLHTGMNVNPMFFPIESTDTAHDPRNSMSHVHPIQRDSLLAGAFEQTREIRLYGTFSIPLIHGWLPLPGSPEYTALSRSAKSYEDAQNIMFREEELEEKLSHEGLSFEEETLLEDISTIKAFLRTNPTQLTTNGLETISSSMLPGSVAILFRNDHFSTLYRHPETMQLLQIVTDMGYAGHDEVVWESLADVNGENCEFFSGDFRLVGENTGYQSAEEGYTTVQSRSKNKGRSAETSSLNQKYDSQGSGMQSPSREQEDHDLALALQLQDEEDSKHREDEARRKREAEFSERYIEQQASNPTTGLGNGRGRGQGTTSSSGVGSSNRVMSGNPSTAQVVAQSASPSQSRPNIPPPRRAGFSTPETRAAAIARARAATAAARPQAPQTSRPIDPEAGVEGPPPSYEMASNEAAYNPPVNHPAHPSTSPSVAQAAAAANQPPTTVPGARRTSNFSQANGNVVYGGAGRRGDTRTSSSSAAANDASADSTQGGKRGSCILM